MNVMTNQQRAAVTDAALMELLTETGRWDQSVGAEGVSLESFLRHCLNRELIPVEGNKRVSINSLMPDGQFDMKKACELYAQSGGDNNSVKILCSAYLQDENFRHITIMDMDETNGAVVTRNDATNTYTVAYCGTRAGWQEWPDNAEGMLNESSPAQESAAHYFDMMSSRFEEGYNVVVTGHSKGGNKAQYVTMFAENRSVIDNCVALDGQGFSQEAMESMQRHGDYAAQRDKITLVCGSDDYVHVLGERLAREDQTYYLQGNHRMTHAGSSAFLQDHQVQYRFVNTEGHFIAELNTATEQGELSRFVEAVYKRAAAELDSESFAFVARTAMGMLNGDSLSAEDIIRLIGYAGPLVEDVLFRTPEGRAFLNTLPQELVSNKNMQGPLGAANLIVMWLFSVDADNPATQLVKQSMELLGVDFITFDELLKTLLQYVSTGVNIYDGAKDFLYVNLGIGESPYSQTGATIANGYANMAVNTTVMLDCVDRLRALRERTESLSGRLRNAFNGKRGNESALEIVAGGVVDDLSGDKERMENARAHMAKAAEGMSVIAKALCSMVEKLENAEQTAAKYGRMGG